MREREQGPSDPESDSVLERKIGLRGKELERPLLRVQEGSERHPEYRKPSGQRETVPRDLRPVLLDEQEAAPQVDSVSWVTFEAHPEGLSEFVPGEDFVQIDGGVRERLLLMRGVQLNAKATPQPSSDANVQEVPVPGVGSGYPIPHPVVVFSTEPEISKPWESPLGYIAEQSKSGLEFVGIVVRMFLIEMGHSGPVPGCPGYRAQAVEEGVLHVYGVLVGPTTAVVSKEGIQTFYVEDVVDRSNRIGETSGEYVSVAGDGVGSGPGHLMGVGMRCVPLRRVAISVPIKSLMNELLVLLGTEGSNFRGAAVEVRESPQRAPR